MPPLRGKRDTDWAAFAKVYAQVLAELPDDATRAAVAEAAIRGMADSLYDNHVGGRRTTASHRTPPE